MLLVLRFIPVVSGEQALEKCEVRRNRPLSWRRLWLDQMMLPRLQLRAMRRAVMTHPELSPLQSRRIEPLSSRWRGGMDDPAFGLDVDRVVVLLRIRERGEGALDLHWPRGVEG